MLHELGLVVLGGAIGAVLAVVAYGIYYLWTSHVSPRIERAWKNLSQDCDP